MAIIDNAPIKKEDNVFGVTLGEDFETPQRPLGSEILDMVVAPLHKAD